MMRPLKKARRCEHWAAGLGSAGLAEAIMASIGVEWVGSCLQFDLLVNFIEEWRYLIECNPDLPRTACVKPMWHWSPESNHASIVENGLIEGGSEGVPVRNGSAHGKGVYGSPDICAARDYGERARSTASKRGEVHACWSSGAPPGNLLRRLEKSKTEWKPYAHSSSRVWTKPIACSRHAW